MRKKNLILTISLLFCTVILPPGTFIVWRQYLLTPAYSKYMCGRSPDQNRGQRAVPVKERIPASPKEVLLASLRGELLRLCSQFIPRKAKPLLESYLIKTLSQSYQTFNNCGPASLSMLLSCFRLTASQEEISERLRPHKDDKHTSMDELAGYARGLGLQARSGRGGDRRVVKELVAAGLPVMLKVGLDPENDAWMCHYIVVVGYSDRESRFILMDSLYGPYFPYSYAEADIFWAHFMWTYLVIFPPEKRELVESITGKNYSPANPGTGQNPDSPAPDTGQNPGPAKPDIGLKPGPGPKPDAWLKIRVYQAVLDSPQEPFAWYNLGRLLLDLDRKREAETAMQTARDLGLPWRLPWYDFSLYQVYLSNSRYAALMDLTGLVLARNPYSEETRYYRALALLAQGKTASALAELDRALEVNPHFSPAITLLKEIRKAD
jgi:tetratricopeptide (TPR) repeat protein